MVDEGMGYSFCFDKIINISGESNLCFRPLASEIRADMSIMNLPLWTIFFLFSEGAVISSICHVKNFIFFLKSLAF